jgi:hypothetical protein
MALTLATTSSLFACANDTDVAPMAAPMSLRPASSAAHDEFEIVLPDNSGPLFLSCIGEEVWVNSTNVHLAFNVVTTPNGHVVTRARIFWPTHSFYVERQNGVRYFQPDNAPSSYHEFDGPVHFITITDPWNLRSASGELLKFQAHQRITFDDDGNVTSYKITGACP